MWDTFKAVLWGFLGVRSSRGYEDDQKKLKVQHVIAAGIFCALIFVVSLFFLVRMLTTK
ncbi:MAG: DUF2970 domain-containing protein [Betaproteobacteria bacterium]|nr:DUF2970 domain-containing protein [Betaproteobacteria bacterium]